MLCAAVVDPAKDTDSIVKAAAVAAVVATAMLQIVEMPPGRL